ncbi:MAG: selenium-dependent molybdenum cofactor biosynthesis protein YqeB, partial [Eubacteriaceae bacterium]
PDPEQVPQVLFINKEDLNPEGALDIAEAARGLFDRIYIGSVKENRIREVTGSSYCPLILAAGLSSRMQKIAADKLMMPYRDGTILSETVSNVKALTGMSPVVVVKDNIAVSGDIRTVMNPEPERGQGSSLGLGVSAVRAEYGNKNRILVFLGDQPDVSRRTVCSVLRMSEKYPDKIIIPVFNEKPGHPVVFPARYFNELETLNGETAGKTIIAAHPDQIIRINCDRSTVTDTDTPDDYYRLINRSQENNMETIQKTRKIIIVRGAGDLATGTLLRLHRAGFPVVALDIPEPTVIRRTVSLAPALTQGKADVEGVIGVRCATIPEIYEALKADEIPIVADPGGKLIEELRPRAVVDAILAKRNLGTTRDMAPIVVGLGPGFTAGEDVDAVVETQRGHDLGRVIYKGSAVPNTGVPGMIGGYASERVIHSPAAGVIRVIRDIGSSVTAGETVAEIKTADGESVPVKTEIAGVLRGMIQPGMEVQKGLKIADVDPRDVRSNCWSVSDKANAIAGGVLEAILHLKNRKYPGLSADEIPEPDRPAE